MFTPADREATLARAIELLRADPRVEAAVITGSMGRGDADRWSDFDLSAILRSEESAAELADDWDVLAYREWPVVHHYATAFGETLVRGYLLSNGLLADLGFTPLEEFSAWAPVKVAFDHGGSVTAKARELQPWSPEPDWRGEAGYAFHDVLHACTTANRGKLWQSLYYLQRIRNRTLALASERHGWDSDELTRVDDLPAMELDPLRATLVDNLERSALLGAIEAATSAFLAELRRGDPELADRLAGPLDEFVRSSIDAV